MANEESPKPDGIPAVDIPDLKQKEKDRKKAGASWGQGAKAGNAFEGAVGGSGAGGGVARAAASAAARGVGQAGLEAGGTFFSRLAQFLARMMTTALGKMAVAAAVAVMVGGVAAVARFAGGGAGGDAAGGNPALGDISSSIRVKRDGDVSGLNMAKNNGLVQFGAKPAAAPPPDAGKAPDAGAPVDGATAQDAAGAVPGALDRGNAMAAQQDRLAHNMSMSKLSSSLGQGGGFGGKDIFSGGPKLGRGFNAAQLSAASKNAGKKGAVSSRAKVSAHAAQRRGAFKGSRALGRLMQMATLNRGMKATGTGAETASTMATDQFEGQKTTGGAAPPGSTADAGGSANPGGSTGGGGGDTGGDTNPNVDGACTSLGMMADANGNCIQPNIGGGINVSPWMGLLTSAQKMMGIAKALLYIASALYIIAEAWLCTGCCAYVGAIIAAIVAVIMTIVITVLGAVIKSMGDQIKDMGQEGLGNTVNDIGNDLITGAWIAVIGGIGGFWFAGQVSDKMDTLGGQMEDAITEETEGLTEGLPGTGTGTGTGTGGGTGP